MATGRRNTEWLAGCQLIKLDGHDVLWLYSGVDDFGAALTARRCKQGVWLRPSGLCACTVHSCTSSVARCACVQ